MKKAFYMKHKWFCVLLAAIMIFCLFPSAVIAANTESTFTQAPSIFHITASCDDSNSCTAKVSARAAAGDSFQLFIAVYQADGKFIDVDCQTADFTSAEQTFTAAFSAVPTGAVVKAFFLSTDYRPLSSANAVITNAVASSIAQLARTHNVKQLSSVGTGRRCTIFFKIRKTKYPVFSSGERWKPISNWSPN